MHDARTMHLWSAAWLLCLCLLPVSFAAGEADHLVRKPPSEGRDGQEDEVVAVDHHGEVEETDEVPLRDMSGPRHKRARNHGHLTPQEIVADRSSLEGHRTEIPSHTEVEVRYVEGVPVYVTAGDMEAKSFLQAPSTKKVVMVFFKPGTHWSLMNTACTSCGVRCRWVGHPTTGVAMMAIETTARGLVCNFRQNKESLEFAEIDFKMQIESPGVGGTQVATSLSVPPNSPGINVHPTWGVFRVDNRENKWDHHYEPPHLAHDGNEVNVYVLDTGIRASHGELLGRVVPYGSAYNDFGQRFVHSCKNQTMDCARDLHGHGTAVASVIAGTTVGIASRATVYSVRVLDQSGAGDASDIMGAMDRICRNHVKPAVIYLSAGARGHHPSVDKTIAEVSATCNITVVVAAGNHGDNACGYTPSAAPEAIRVGATTETDMLSSFSNWGECVDIMAPGSHIKVAGAQSDNTFVVQSGTGLAAAHVAGAAALVLAAFDDFAPHQVRDQIINTSTEGRVQMLPSIKSWTPNRLLYTKFLDTPLEPPVLSGPVLVPAPAMDQGPLLEQGDIGFQGHKGLSGRMGEDGPRGPRGPQGPKGYPGRQGPIGEAGPLAPHGSHPDRATTLELSSAILIFVVFLTMLAVLGYIELVAVVKKRAKKKKKDKGEKIEETVEEEEVVEGEDTSGGVEEVTYAGSPQT
mmetsp:Transcript_8623/g.15488  ORF Transcript_8623/g.15488 Transcript_8623/m.15488 type:complete len:689 (+) Transcript_8623:80-2146(+)